MSDDLCSEPQWPFLTPQFADVPLDEPISLGDAAELYGISYDTLATAARQGRLDAPRHGQRGRRTTRRAVEMALASGAIRPGQRGPRPKQRAPT